MKLGVPVIDALADRRQLTGGALGAWVKIPAIEVIEALAGAGADFVVIDREHGIVDSRMMTDMIAVSRGLGLPVFVRVPGTEPRDLVPPLDAGADGVFVPQVDSPDAARAVVDAVRLPPAGSRGASPVTRVGRWGALGPGDLTSRANDEVVIVAQIESPLAVQNIDAIAGVDGINALFVGPFDLALASGLEMSSPLFRELVLQVESAAQGRMPFGGTPLPFDVAFDFSIVGADVTFLSQAAKALFKREDQG